MAKIQTLAFMRIFMINVITVLGDPLPLLRLLIIRKLYSTLGGPYKLYTNKILFILNTHGYLTV